MAHETMFCPCVPRVQRFTLMVIRHSLPGYLMIFIALVRRKQIFNSLGTVTKVQNYSGCIFVCIPS